MQTYKTIGVIGLGKMGLPIVKHLLKGGYSVVGYDVRSETVEVGKSLGMTSTPSVADIARTAELVIVLVGFDSEVEEVVCGEQGIASAAREGLVIAIASTVSPRLMKKLAARCDEAGLELLDAPLCRGEWAADSGELLIAAGGRQEVFERCKPVFSTFANSIHYLGPAGSGQTAKMVNNLILWACISANHEGFKLARTLGVEPEPLRQMLIEGSARNWALENRAETLPLPWAEKDMMIVLSEADRARVSLPLCGSLKEVIKGVKIELGQPTPLHDD